MLSWVIEELTFDKENIPLNGSKFLIGNGYMGYRGTLEEFKKDELVSCVLSGVYDKVGDQVREPVNAPNPFMTRLYCNNRSIDALSLSPIEHMQQLDINRAVHIRKSKFEIADGAFIEVGAERFLSADQIHVMVMKYSFKCSLDCDILIETGIDGAVWDINGPHLKKVAYHTKNDDTLVAEAITNEMEYTVAVAERTDADFGICTIERCGQSITRNITVHAEAGREYTFMKYAAIYTTKDQMEDTVRAAAETSSIAHACGYEDLLEKHCTVWKERWKESDVIIEGDERAQLALRYSIYHLLAIAPFHTDEASIPARGLSGQVYKGGVFWDTEMFMLPFFIYSNPKAARNLLKYRCNTLEGARRKAMEYGYRGAFYAWESQDSGEDACTHFNLTDIFTSRPMRTYFRDRQIHVSAGVVYGLWNYYSITGDESIFLDGAAEVILECARFYYSYAYYKMDKNRYEILNVVGPDEYHERVDNNAYTNQMVKFSIDTAFKVMALMKEKYPDKYSELIDNLEYHHDMEDIRKMRELLYIPQPGDDNMVIEQFDGYLRLEDVSLKELKKRIIIPNEYLGGTNGLATTTQILKQSDVLMMLSVFKEIYTEAIKKANWEFYEPRTEHGSSLSHCAYAIVAADIRKTDWAYDYFMKTATIDLTGNAKQYLGTLYIGGTHPAANGGAWMTAIIGFAGVWYRDNTLCIQPKLPSHWSSMKFKLKYRECILNIHISQDKVTVVSEDNNRQLCKVNICGKLTELLRGHENTINYTYSR